MVSCWSYHPQPDMLMRWLMELINTEMSSCVSASVSDIIAPLVVRDVASVLITVPHEAHLLSVSDRRQDERLNVPQVYRRGHAPPPQVPLTWSVTLVSGAGGPSAVVAGRWGRGDRGSPLLAHGRIHSWNTEAPIYKSTFKSFVFLSFCKSLVVLNTFASCLSSFLNVFYLFTFYTGIYHSGNYWYILELAETFFCFILCL